MENTEEATGTSITISWTAPSDSVVDRYEVVWESGGEIIGNVTISGDETSYTISGLEEGRTYSITITPINDAGRGESLKLSVSTPPAAAASTASSVATVAGAAGGGVVLAVIAILVVLILVCVCCR